MTSTLFRSFLFALFISANIFGNLELPPPPMTSVNPTNVEILWPQRWHAVFNELLDEEKQVIAYLSKAMEPLNYLSFMQIHRHGKPILELFLTMYAQADVIRENMAKISSPPFDAEQFLAEVEHYLSFLGVFHGNYASRQFMSKTGKYTPEKLKLFTLTEQNIQFAVELMNLSSLFPHDDELRRSLFDDQFETPLIEPGNFETSFTNIYDKGITRQMRVMLLESNPLVSKRLNTYRMPDNNPAVVPYVLTSDNTNAIRTMLHWLAVARGHAAKFKTTFDVHFLNAIDHIIAFHTHGNDADYKQFLTELVQSTSRIHFMAGFIIRAVDPLNEVGFPTGDIVVNAFSTETQTLTSVLIGMERSLPIDAQFRRSERNTHYPKLVLGHKLLGVGRLGPEWLTAAYALPNDEDVKNAVGTKPVIYFEENPTPQSIERKTLKRNLMMTSKQAGWFRDNDPSEDLFRVLREILTMVHETVGHASGTFTEHVFRGESYQSAVLTKAVNTGEILTLTEPLARELLGAEYSRLEEVRAEIIATYATVVHCDELRDAGFFKQWGQRLSVNELKKWVLYVMTNQGIMGLKSETRDVIMNPYTLASNIMLRQLLRENAIAMLDVDIDVDSIDVEKSQRVLEILVGVVQQLKSTADSTETKLWFSQFDKIGNQNAEAMQFKGYQAKLKEILSTLENQGESLGTAFIYPHFVISDDANEITALWPKSIAHQLMLQQPASWVY